MEQDGQDDNFSYASSSNKRGGGAASSSSNKRGGGAASSAKKAKYAESSEDDEQDEDYEEADKADEAEEAVGAKRLRGVGGRPTPTHAEKRASAAQKVATALTNEAAAKKGAEKAAFEMQKYKESHPGPVAMLLTHVRGIVGQQDWSHAQTITFLNNSSRGFAVSVRYQQGISPKHTPVTPVTPHACPHSLTTPHPTPALTPYPPHAPRLPSLPTLRAEMGRC